MPSALEGMPQLQAKALLLPAAPLAERSLGILKSRPLAGKQPVGVNTGQLDEAQNGMRRNRAPRFVIVQRAEWYAELFGQQRAAVFPIERYPYFAESRREITLYRLPIGIGRDFVHQ